MMMDDECVKITLLYIDSDFSGNCTYRAKVVIKECETTRKNAVC